MKELFHFGIKGQKHGERRWQNEDGSLTPEGRIRYGVGEVKKAAKLLTGSDARAYYKQKAQWKAMDAQEKVRDAHRQFLRSPGGRKLAQLKSDAAYNSGMAFVAACGLISDASLRARGLDPKDYNDY